MITESVHGWFIDEQARIVKAPAEVATWRAAKVAEAEIDPRYASLFEFECLKTAEHVERAALHILTNKQICWNGGYIQYADRLLGFRALRAIIRDQAEIGSGLAGAVKDYVECHVQPHKHEDFFRDFYNMVLEHAPELHKAVLKGVIGAANYFIGSGQNHFFISMCEGMGNNHTLLHAVDCPGLARTFKRQVNDGQKPYNLPHFEQVVFGKPGLPAWQRILQESPAIDGMVVAAA